MNQEYYIQIMGRDAGPFTLEEMYQLIRQGTIQNTTQVRLQDQTQPAFAYTELRVLLELQTRPAPTVKSSVKTTPCENKPYYERPVAHTNNTGWKPGAMMDLFCIYNWVVGILHILSAFCILIPDPFMVICGLLSIPSCIVHLAVARMCRRDPYSALRIFTWMFFIFIIPNLLSIIGFLLELPFVCYYFSNKDRIPRV